MNSHREKENFIPPALHEPVAAALQWINTTQSTQFEVTGLVDEEHALATTAGEPYELGLVLCDGEICRCERVRIEPTDGLFKFSLTEMKAPAVPPLLDPPPGLRRRWFDQQLDNYEFVLLLFYRGRW